MRILLVSHPPLRPEFGAAQLAIELASALRARGHDAIAWSPEPLPRGGKIDAHLGGHFKRQRQAIERHVAEAGPFDVIDLPALSVTRTLAAAGFVVARSIQPDLLYLAASLRERIRHRPFSPLVPLEMLRAARLTAALHAGFRRADVLLCLGRAERDWMARRTPAFGPKLATYVAALSADDRGALADVRSARRLRDPAAGLRFLWLGRWVAQKGPHRLLAWFAARSRSYSNDRHPHDRLTIAGCGNLDLPRRARELAAAGRLRIVPHYERTALPDLLAEHDVGLFTSVAEGWGLSLHEMIESGLPVYATPAGGAPDLADALPRTVRPFPPPDRIDAADLAIDDLDVSGYFERFSWPRIAEEYERLLVERFGR